MSLNTYLNGSETTSNSDSSPPEEFQPRDFQIEIFEIAKKENVIVKLDTGCGKTYIAIMLMKYFLPLTNKPISEGGKRIVFLVQNIHLVYQQAAAILRFLPILEQDVGRYHGDIRGIGYGDLWKDDQWLEQIDGHRILVLTSEVFFSMLRHNKVSIKHICLLVFDECHHSDKNNSYVHICEFVKRHYKNQEEVTNMGGTSLKLPRILGLSATLIKGNIKSQNKADKIEEKLFQLEHTMCSRIITSFLHLHHATSVKEEIVQYKRTLSPVDVLREGEENLIRFLSARNISTETSGKTKKGEATKKKPHEKALKALKNAQRVLEEFGIAGCVCYIKSNEIELRHMQALDSVDKCAVELTLKSYEELLRVAKLATMSPKVFALMEVLSKFGEAENPSTMSDIPLENPESTETEKSVINMNQYVSHMNNVISNLSSSPTVSTSFKRVHEAKPVKDSISSLPQEHRLSLLKHIDSSSNEKESFRGIIFVKERKDAHALLNVLQMFVAVEPDKYGFLKPAMITGHGKTSEQASAFSTSIRQQDRILSRFRAGEINLLLATKVVEEGLDVAHCNLVIQLDPPEEFRSYIQAKGRARRADSRYMVFCQEDEFDKVDYRMTDFRLLNEQINKMIKSKSVEASYVEKSNSGLHETMRNGLQNEMDSAYFPFGPEGPRISCYDAVSVLNKYIGSLRSDSIGPLKMKVEYIVTAKKLNRVHLTLPRPCPIFDPIQGPVCGNKRKAKQLAALEACKRLHLIDELDESLLPYRRRFVTEYGDVEGDLEDFKSKVGTTSAKRTYKVSVAHSLSSKQRKVVADIPDYIAHGGQLHVQILRFEPDLHECFKEIQPSSLIYDENRFAILSPIPIRNVPTIAMFPLILPREMTTICRVDYIKTIDGLTEDKAQQLITAHEALFNLLSIQQRALWFQESDTSQSRFLWDWKATNCSFVVCPVNKDTGDIAWNCIQDLCKSASKSYQENILFSRDKSEWLGALVSPLHTAKDRRPCIVLRICEELSPESEIPVENVNTENKTRKEVKKSLTFRGLYARRYPECKINNINTLPQPMLASIRLPAIGSTIRKRSDKRAEPTMDGDNYIKCRRVGLKSDSYNSPYLIPQLCEWVPLSPSLFLQLRLFPDIWYRLNQLLLAEELFEKMAPTMEWKSLQDEPLILDFEGKIPLPKGEYMNPTRLLNALTCIQCNDLHNLERLEVLGDSFLKYITSVYLHNLIRPTQQEGVMSRIRSSIVSNKNLYRWAIQRGLHRYVYAHNWIIKTNFIPPGCVVNPDAAPHIQNQYEERIIHDKTLADCVEGLLGCVLRFNVHFNVLKLMRWFSYNEDEFCKVMNDTNKPILGDPLRLRQWYLTDKGNMCEDEIRDIIENAYNDVPIMKSSFINPSCKDVDRSVMESLILGRDLIEKVLAYKFRNPLLLLEATTHPSDLGNQFTNCYQRLEFLGDAAIDLLITIRIFHANPSMSPGELTDLRSALVNNNLFAILSVKHGLHKCIRYENSSLFDHISAFVQHQTARGHPVRDSEFIGEDGEKVMLKVLGDVIESIMGAILIDSEMNLIALDNVVFSLMEDVMTDFSKDVPKSPVRLCYETFTDIRFKKATVFEGGQLISLTAICKGEAFTVRERNIRLCKHQICRKILERFSPSAR